MNLGGPEILVILILALIVFGPKRLPEVGRQVGGALRELRGMERTVRGEIESALHAEPPTSRDPATDRTPDTSEAPEPAPGPAPRPAEGRERPRAVGSDVPTGPDDSFL